MTLRSLGAATLGALLVTTMAACDRAEEALTAHARPAAEAAGFRLGSDDLAEIMAKSAIPDSALTPSTARSVAELWGDYIRLVALYQRPDTVLSIDYIPFLRRERFLAAFAIEQFRDSVIYPRAEPTQEDVRRYFDEKQPFTRLKVRRIVVPVPDSATQAVRDSLLQVARRARQRIVDGEDFVQVAREVSRDPKGAPGRVLDYQGHDDFPPNADSTLFHLSVGDVSPVIPTDRAMLIYRIEDRTTPSFADARDEAYRKLRDQRRLEVTQQVVDSLIENAHRQVKEGAVALARRIAADSSMEEGKVSAGTELVTYRGGAVTVRELRKTFRTFPPIRNAFIGATDSQAHDYLLRLARDEIILAAVHDKGYTASAAAQDSMTKLVQKQIGQVARRMRLSHNLVVAPAFDADRESRAFLSGVLRDQKPVPLLGVFGGALDQDYPTRVDPEGVQTAAREARKLRADGVNDGREDSTSHAGAADSAASPASGKAPGTTPADSGGGTASSS